MANPVTCVRDTVGRFSHTWIEPEVSAEIDKAKIAIITAAAPPTIMMRLFDLKDGIFYTYYLTSKQTENKKWAGKESPSPYSAGSVITSSFFLDPVTWYWFRCRNGDRLLLRTNHIHNLGVCPYCQAEWIRMDEKEIASVEAKMRQTERFKTHFLCPSCLQLSGD